MNGGRLGPALWLAVIGACLPPLAWAETLIYEGTLDGVAVDQNPQLVFAVCEGDVCSPPLEAQALIPHDADGRFSYELVFPHTIPVGPATRLQVALRLGEAAPVVLAQQRLSRRLFNASPTLPPTAPDETGVRLVELIADCSLDASAPSQRRFDSIPAALSWLSVRRIPVGWRARIVVPRNCRLDQPLHVAHVDGARLEIVGRRDPEEPVQNRVTLLFPQSDGVVVDHGHQLGSLSGFVITKGLTQEQIEMPERSGAGVSVSRNAALTASDLECIGFADGFQVRHGGVLASLESALRASKGQNGFRAIAGGMIILAPDARAEDNRGNGFIADDGSYIEAPDAIARGNGSWGFNASHHSLIRATRAQAVDNGGGFVADLNSTIYAPLATAETNTGDGFSAAASSAVLANRGMSTNNDGRGVFASLLSVVVHAARDGAICENGSDLEALHAGLVFTPGTEVCAVPDLNTEFLQAFTEGQEPQNASLPNRYGWISP